MFTCWILLPISCSTPLSFCTDEPGYLKFVTLFTGSASIRIVPFCISPPPVLAVHKYLLRLLPTNCKSWLFRSISPQLQSPLCLPLVFVHVITSSAINIPGHTSLHVFREVLQKKRKEAIRADVWWTPTITSNSSVSPPVVATLVLQPLYIHALFEVDEGAMQIFLTFPVLLNYLSQYKSCICERSFGADCSSRLMM